MEKQLIISLGREFGSGGHIIAHKLAEKYDLPVYDRNILQEIARERNLDGKDLEEYDEVKRNKLFSRTVRGFNNSPAHNVAYLQFDYLKKMAADGKSFVVIGRCAETILNEYDALVSIFVLADEADKIERVMERHHVEFKEAVDLCESMDKRRKQYHNSYCAGKWGDSRNYDISINVSRLGIDETVRVLCDYIDARLAGESTIVKLV